jgi:hypothetical protein
MINVEATGRSSNATARSIDPEEEGNLSTV